MCFCFLPEFRFIDIFLTQFGRIMQAKPHHIFINPKDFKIFQVHFIHRLELLAKLSLRAVNMRIIHMQAAHPHQSKQFAALFIPVTGSIFRQPERQVFITLWLRGKYFMVMRAVHRFQIIFCSIQFHGRDTCYPDNTADDRW